MRGIKLTFQHYMPEDTYDGEHTYFDTYDEFTECETVEEARDVVEEAGCKAPSSWPGPLTLAAWWSLPDGSYEANAYTGERVEVSAHPVGLSVDEINAVNGLLGNK